jgi:protocatechuate 3,4-dioxygenase beta subunit
MVFSAVLISSAKGSPVLIEAREADSLQPIAGTKVVIMVASNINSGVTGAEGVCALDSALAPGARIEVQKDGWCPMRWEVTATDLAIHPSRFLFSLPRATTLSGVVVDESKTPIAGAHVDIYFPQRLSGPHIPLDDLPAVSDSSGRWQAAFVPGNIATVHIDVTEPNHQWDQSQPDPRELRDGKAVLAMTTLRAVRGRVVDPSGQPVAGALVYLGDEWGIMGLGNAPSVITDDHGSFHFSSTSLGKKQLAAWDSRFGPVTMPIDSTAAMSPVELRLTVPHPRKFRVTDLDGRPLTNATAKVSEWESFHYPPQEFSVDADGRFIFSNAPSGRIAIDFTAPDHFGLIMRPVAETAEEQVIQLGPSLRLHGKVTDQKTGAPLSEFKVTPGWPTNWAKNFYSIPSRI